MPATIHKISPEAGKMFERWVDESDATLSVLMHPFSAISKLVLVHCLPESLCTNVYEQELQAGVELPEIEQNIASYMREFTPNHLAASLFFDVEHLSSLDDAPGTNQGLVVTHRAYKAKQFE